MAATIELRGTKLAVGDKLYYIVDRGHLGYEVESRTIMHIDKDKGASFGKSPYSKSRWMYQTQLDRTPKTSGWVGYFTESELPDAERKADFRVSIAMGDELRCTYANIERLKEKALDLETKIRERAKKLVLQECGFRVSKNHPKRPA